MQSTKILRLNHYNGLTINSFNLVDVKLPFNRIKDGVIVLLYEIVYPLQVTLHTPFWYLILTSTHTLWVKAPVWVCCTELEPLLRL